MNAGTFVMDLTIPCAWPPTTLVNVFDGQFEKSRVCVVACPSGTLHLQVHSAAGTADCETPRLALPDFAFLKVAFAWGDGSSPTIAINGQLIACYTNTPQVPVVVIAKSHPSTGFRIPLEFAVPSSCDAVEQNLLRSILELQQRVAETDKFNLLQAAAILRRLLLDASPVIHLANKEYKASLRFPVVDERSTTNVDLGPVFTLINFCPDFADTAEISLLSLDKLLAKAVLRDNERDFSVRDVIKVCANLKGGIHFGEPESQEEKSLIRLDEKYLVFFSEASLAALPGIVWSVIVGLRPLVDAIFAKYGAIGGALQVR
jgi:hypothetical protein